MNRASHFSLWLPLPSPAQERFQALITQLAARLGTPVFVPHIPPDWRCRARLALGDAVS
jgi:hypothetical protein